MLRRKSKISVNYYASHSVELVKGGTEYFKKMLEIINKAQYNIHLQVYIFADDETGRLVTTALKKAVERNVKVYLLVDGYASQDLSILFIKELEMAGIYFRFFEPFFKSDNFYFGRRMHQKILVADAGYALVGGVNISNKYNDSPNSPAWLDFAMYVEGDVAFELCKLCRKNWLGYLQNKNILNCKKDKINFNEVTGKSLFVRIGINDWVRRKNEISRIYIEMFSKAKTNVILLGSYFLPGRKIRRHIIKAINRGVEVKIIAAGPSDVRIAKYAERWLYDWLLRNKVQLYEYQKSILHGKLAVRDSQWTTVGSYNVNNISAYASLELNLALQDEAFAKHTENVLQQIIDNDCKPVSLEQHLRTKNIFKQFIRWASYQLIRILFYLFTFYFKQRN